MRRYVVSSASGPSETSYVASRLVVSGTRASSSTSISNGQARTLRMLTKADDVGFGFSDVHFSAGAETVLWYKHHWEANHILAGTGLVTELATGRSWKLEPGVSYNVGPKDRHSLRADTAMHLVSVFCPPLEGHEQHDAGGTLTASGPVPPGPDGP